MVVFLAGYFVPGQTGSPLGLTTTKRQYRRKMSPWVNDSGCSRLQFMRKNSRIFLTQGVPDKSALPPPRSALDFKKGTYIVRNYISVIDRCYSAVIQIGIVFQPTLNIGWIGYLINSLLTLATTILFYLWSPTTLWLGDGNNKGMRHFRQDAVINKLHVTLKCTLKEIPVSLA